MVEGVAKCATRKIVLKNEMTLYDHTLEINSDVNYNGCSVRYYESRRPLSIRKTVARLISRLSIL